MWKLTLALCEVIQHYITQLRHVGCGLGAIGSSHIHRHAAQLDGGVLLGIPDGAQHNTRGASSIRSRVHLHVRSKVPSHLPYQISRSLSALSTMPDPLEPPPHRTISVTMPTRKPKEKSRWASWAESLAQKGVKINDWASTYVNSAVERFGGERFMPVSHDFELEVAKCTRILRTFTTDGIAVKDDKLAKVKVMKKIPPQVLRDAKGICIYTCMKSGIAPMGGMNGTGLLLGRLPDGSWSPPSSILPGYTSVGFMFGMDIVDIILIINTDEMLKSFRTHKFALSAETVTASGPLGTPVNGGLEFTKKVAPIFSYVNSRGFYAGMELTGQMFFDRFDENERVYYWPGITAGDILDGKVRMPEAAEPLITALREAEHGVAQAGVLEQTEIMKNLPSGINSSNLEETLNSLQEGEHIQLPPTPEQLDAMEHAGYKDEYDEAWEEKVRQEVRNLPPPPTHPSARKGHRVIEEHNIAKTSSERSSENALGSKVEPGQLTTNAASEAGKDLSNDTNIELVRSGQSTPKAEDSAVTNTLTDVPDSDKPRFEMPDMNALKLKDT